MRNIIQTMDHIHYSRNLVFLNENSILKTGTMILETGKKIGERSRHSFDQAMIEMDHQTFIGDFSEMLYAMDFAVVADEEVSPFKMEEGLFDIKVNVPS